MLFALAGTGSLSGTLSSNLSIRKQQLICDPPAPTKGSTSLLYDASKVTLADIIPGPGYDNQGFIGLVELRLKNGKTALHPFSSFRNDPKLGVETGYAQVIYKLQGTPGDMSAAPGYELIEEYGDEAGVDTHSFFFTLKPGVSNAEPFAYRVYAERAGVHSGNVEDGITDATGATLGPDDIQDATVRSDFKPEIQTITVPSTIAEGNSLTLSAFATDKDSPASSLTYFWDVNGDNVVDATGATATLTSAQLNALGIGDGAGTATVRLTVSDGPKSDTAQATLSITNVAPTAGVSATTGSVVVPVALNLTSNDPSDADDAAGFDFLVDWGDGSPLEVVEASAGNGAGTNLTHQYALGGTYTVTALATDKDGGTSALASTSVLVINTPPVIVSNGGPYSISEGSGVTLLGVATDAETPTTLTYAWDINGDSVVDATGANPTLSASALIGLGLGDGPTTKNVTLTVSDGQNTVSSATTILVNNVNPDVTLTPTTAAILLGASVAFSTTITDPCAADTHTYAWSVNSVLTGVTTSTFTFNPATDGVFTVKVVATDDDGGTDVATATVTVTDPDATPTASIGADPANPGKNALFVKGTKFNDLITFSKSGNNTGVNVSTSTNTFALGSFTGFDRLIVRGIGGNDNIQLNYTSASEVLIFGGDGDDTINAGNYQSILIGGAGKDTLIAGNSKDLLAGGAGKDSLSAGAGDDLLISERSVYDAGSGNTDIIAWTQIMKEWTSGSTLASRQSNITGQTNTGVNGAYVLRATANTLGPATYFNDAEVDVLDGGTGKNWLL
ncbi:PKD domain-containing protein [Humisphaera borealis]|uniref:PKD domain-containing protein n=1 Tax=Humisphaera borealis TaxID=2807512 RepID=A0A7M2X333_9BACT|nr:PKD domain-containing protein [Humisphaera borealis]QOV92168.1 hypothetical protein IPV69_12760 [Humisphaera borealis]